MGVKNLLMLCRELITGCSENRAIVEVCCMVRSSGLVHLESGGACSNWYALDQQFLQFFCRSRTPFWLRQITTDRHIFAHVNIVCMDDDRYTELNIYISKLVVDSYQYVPVAYIRVHCMI